MAMTQEQIDAAKFELDQDEFKNEKARELKAARDRGPWSMVWFTIAKIYRFPINRCGPENGRVSMGK